MGLTEKAHLRYMGPVTLQIGKIYAAMVNQRRQGHSPHG